MYLSNIYFSREYCSTIDNVLSKVSTQIEDCKQRTFTTKWIQSRFYISFCLLKNSFHMMVNREVLFHTESTLSENFQTFFPRDAHLRPKHIRDELKRARIRINVLCSLIFINLIYSLWKWFPWNWIYPLLFYHVTN